MSTQASAMNNGELRNSRLTHADNHCTHGDTKKGPRGKRAGIRSCLDALLSCLQWDWRTRRTPHQGTTQLYTLRQILSIIGLQEVNGPKGHSYCCIRYSRLAELTGQSERTTKRHVQRLIDWGYLERTRRWRRRSRTQRSNLYKPGKRLIYWLKRLRARASHQGDKFDTHNPASQQGSKRSAATANATTARPAGSNRSDAPHVPPEKAESLIKRMRKLLG